MGLLRSSVLAMMLVASTLACGAEGPERANANAMWQQDDPWVRVNAPEPLLLPASDPPAHTTITSMALPQEDALPPAGGSDSAQTIWADPTRNDPLDGPMLLVARTSMSDIEGRFGSPDGRRIDLGGRPARIEHRGPATIVSWSIDVPDEVCIACDQSAVVAGRKLSEKAVLAAARAARPTDLRPTTDARAVPTGLRSLGTLPGLGHGDRWSAIEQRIDLRVAGDDIGIRVVEGDPRLQPHLRFWIDGGRAIAHPVPSPVDVVAVGDRIVVAEQFTRRQREGNGPERFVASLTDATEEEVRAVRRQVIERPPDAADECIEGIIGEGRAATFAGAVDDARWSLTISADDDAVVWCQLLDTGTGSGELSGAGGGDPTQPLAEPSSVRILGGGNSSLNGGGSYRFIAGDVPAATAIVRVTVPGHGEVEAQLADVGPEAGRRWFGTAVRLSSGPPQGGEVVVVAYDGEGNEIARTRPS